MESDLTDWKSDPNGRESNPDGMESDLTDWKSDPNGRESDPNGR